MASSFDGKAYHREVLAKLRRKWEDSGELPPLLARYGLTDADPLLGSATDDLADHLDAVNGFWGNKANDPRFGDFARALAREHDAARAELLDSDRREELRRSEAGHEYEREQQAAGALNTELEAAARAGIVPVRDVKRLRAEFGKSRGELERAAYALGLSLEQEVQPTSSEVMKIIHDQLSRFPRLLSASGEEGPQGVPRRLSMSLYGFLRLLPDASESQVHAALETRSREHARRGADDLKTCLGNLNAQVKKVLLDPDQRAAYDQALVEHAAREIAGDVVREASDDRVGAGAYAVLLERAMDLGLTEGFAGRAVAMAGRDAEVVFEVATGRVPYVACAECQKANPATGNRCTECGSELFSSCAECGERQPAAAQACDRCGHDLGADHRAEGLMVQAEVDRSRGRLTRALDKVREALALAPHLPALSEFARVLEADRDEAQRKWNEIRAACSNGEVFAARTALADLLHSVPDFEGDPVLGARELELQLDDRVAETTRELQRARAATSKGERERALGAALHAAGDCREALQLLSQIPPAPPTDVRAELASSNVRLMWSPSASPGRVTYGIRVLSDEGSAIAEHEVAEPLLAHEAPGGARFSYEVRTQRAGAVSDWVRSASVPAAYPVGNLVIECGDGLIRLGWDRIAGQRVRITRQDFGGTEEELGTHPAPPFADEGVVNGRVYEYVLTAVYASSAGTVTARGVRVVGTPVARPDPVEDLEVEQDDRGVSVRWNSPASGTVEVYRLAARPDHSVGEQLDAEALTRLGESLPTFEPGRARDGSVGPGEAIHYLPVSRDGLFATCGRAVPHVTVPPVSNVHIVAEGERGRLTWYWPDGVREVKVVARHDAPPTGPEDPLGRGTEVTLDRYQREGGISVDCGGGTVHVAIYAAARIGARPVFGGIAARASLEARPRRVSYSVRFTKRGKRLEVRVHGDEPIPELVLVGRSGSAPVDRSRAEVELARLSDAEREAVVALNGVRRPLFVRAFVEEPTLADEVELIHPSERELRLS